MATAQLTAGGGRRSAAPTYAPRSALTSAAQVSDDDLLRQLVASFQPGAVAAATSAPNINELLSAGSGVVDMSGGSAAMAGANSPSGGFSPGALSAIGTGVSALGTLGQNAGLGQLGGMLGLAGAVGQAPSNEAALGMFGQAALSMAGVPGVGLVSNAVQGNVSGMINSALAMANPGLAAINALSGVLGIGTLGSALGGMFGGGGDAGTPGQSDASNATGISGLGFSDAAAGPGFGLDASAGFGGNSDGSSGLGDSSGNSSGGGFGVDGW